MRIPVGGKLRTQTLDQVHHHTLSPKLHFYTRGLHLPSQRERRPAQHLHHCKELQNKCGFVNSVL